MRRALILLIAVASGAAARAAGPVVACPAGTLGVDAAARGEVLYLGRVGKADLFTGVAAAGLGQLILDDARGRFFYKVEGGATLDLSPYGEVLFQSDGDVLLSRQSGFIYDRPLARLGRPWRRLRPAPFRTGGGSHLPALGPDPDGRVQYLLSRVTEADIEDDLAGLTSFPTRYSYSPYLEAAAAWLDERFRSFGLAPYYETVISAHDFDSCFFLPGTSEGWVVGQGGLILHTRDAGMSWDLAPYVTDEELVDVFFADANDGWAVGTNGTVLRTTDGGATWELEPPPTTAHLTGVHFVSASEGWACGTAGVILHTTDGGVSWQPQNSQMTDTLFELQFLDALHGYAVGWHGEVRRTDDGGVTWVRKVTPLVEPPGSEQSIELTGLSFLTPLEGWVVGNRFDAILYTADGGDSWDLQRYDLTAGEYLGAVAFRNASFGVAVGGEEGRALRTTDGGATWTVIDTPAEDALTGLSFATDETAWACGYGSSIDYTADGGQSWVSRRDRLPPELGWKNVVCDIPGAREPGAQYLVVAHYDSISDEPWTRAPGADDNGSGVVAALAAARVLADAAPARTVRVVLFAGEEQGLVGSRDYARRARERGDDIRGVWNMDMVGYTGAGPDDSLVIYNDNSAGMANDARVARRLYVPGLALYTENNPVSANSDHWSFWQEDYAATCLHEYDEDEFYPYYHSGDDTMDKLALAYLTGNARLTTAVVASWAGLTESGPTLSLADARVYPNPYKPARQGDCGVTFDRVPSDARITVYNLAGEEVAAGVPDSGGAWVWPGRVGSGVYLYVLTRGSERRAAKVAIVN